MQSQEFKMDLGSLGEWAGAIASAVISGIALVQSNHASREVQKLERRRQELDRKIHEQTKAFEDASAEWQLKAALRDEDQRKRQAVAGVSAWWACKREDDKNKWGLVIVNEGPYAGPVTKLHIDAKSKYDKPPFKLKFLPPGQYFVESLTKEPYDWSFPEIISSSDHIAPITKSKDYAVEAFSCTDPLGTSWKWTPQNGWTD